LGVFNTFVILTVSYFVIISIAALVVFVTRRDLLDRKLPTSPGSMWRERQDTEPTLENVRRQF